MAQVMVRSFYTSRSGDEEKEHGETYVVPALENETPEGTLSRKHQGAQKHGYTVLQFYLGLGKLETQKYFDDATEHPTDDYYKKRYYFWVE